MRLLCSVFVFWVSALSTAVHAQSEVFAYFCKSADEADTFPILYEQKDGELTLLGDINAVQSMKKVAPKVFEFRFLNPAHVGYLREIEGSWKFLFSDAGIVQTSDCNDLSNELDKILGLYASRLRENGGTSDLDASLGAPKLVQNLLAENQELELRFEQRKVLLNAARQELDRIEKQSAQRASDLIEAAKQIRLLEAQVTTLRSELEHVVSKHNFLSEEAVVSLQSDLVAAIAQKFKVEDELQTVRNDLQAALAAQLAADALADERLKALEELEILLAEARSSLSSAEQLSRLRKEALTEAADEQLLLTEQVAYLRDELGKLQELLNKSE